MSQTHDTLDHEADGVTADASQPSRMGWVLGLGGLVPFVLISGLLVYGGTETIAYGTVVLALTAYSASILAFLGGIRWGLGLRPRPHQAHELLLSVLPSLAGWVLVLVPAPYVFAGFAACFALQGGWDLNSARRGKLPPWFARLRLVLTIVVVLCHTAVFVRTF
ncbi:DUF3429 domain-containing protein [Fulvimarina sp. 2208YS6-2-32]|uniref:DUF3429 domain-containing protein n=1 Tax=Fulvimarina uroteuthidis TaxID=3098149 RepID=A0ABU5I2K2_9HYPH|nr:DUF3429 domain-containing protein [Fulvimarina sp. 2208YS6-2-32]MDY8109565.1 DUF3429 domain-containing protein [Fulvimarina sp. 2208YS6-2-32]